MKRCAQCKNIKSEEDFNKDIQQKSRLKPYCKNCMKLRNIEYGDKNRIKIIQKKKEYYQQNKESIQKRLKIYSQKNLFRYQAHRKVNNAIRDGRLMKKPCEICNDSKSEAHHFRGYAPKNWLIVQWLCRKDHVYVH